jgi:hypothetical protein
MKKQFIFSSVMLLVASSLFAAAGNNQTQQPSNTAGQAQSMTGNAPDCSKMSPAEQSFANQLTDMGNKGIFCSQFSSQQRQQAMQMVGQPDTSGNVMNADQAVNQVLLQSQTPATQPKKRAGGACPVK